MKYSKKEWEGLYKDYQSGERSLAYVVASLSSRFKITPAVVKRDVLLKDEKYDFVFGEPKLSEVTEIEPSTFELKRTKGCLAVSFINLHEGPQPKRVPILVWV